MADSTTDPTEPQVATDPEVPTNTDGTAPAEKTAAGPVDGVGDATAVGTDETFPKPDGTPQAPNGLAAAADQSNASTPATADQPVNGVPKSDLVSNENAVEQTTGRHTQATEDEIERIEDWVKDNYRQLVADGVRTWRDVEQQAEEMEDRALAGFARKAAAESGTTVDAKASKSATGSKTTR